MDFARISLISSFDLAKKRLKSAPHIAEDLICCTLSCYRKVAPASEGRKRPNGPRFRKTSISKCNSTGSSSIFGFCSKRAAHASLIVGLRILRSRQGTESAIAARHYAPSSLLKGGKEPQSQRWLLPPVFQWLFCSLEFFHSFPALRPIPHMKTRVKKSKVAPGVHPQSF